MQPTNRTSTAIDATPVGALAAEYVQRYWQHNPSAATYAGVKGFDHLLDDYGPDNSAMQALDEEFLQRLAATPTATDAERVAAEVFEHELRAELIAHRTGYGMRAWGVITSPASEIRELLELMDTDTPAQRGAVVSRIRQIPRALTQWHELLLSAHRDGNVNSRHATLETIRQFRQIAEEAVYTTMCTELDEVDQLDGEHADAAHAATADFLEDTYLPFTRDEIGVGIDAYRELSAAYTGCEIDLLGAYHAALVEIVQIRSEITALAHTIYPELDDITEVITRLDDDPRYRMSTREELITAVRRLVEDATTALADQFTIPEEIRFCDVKLDDASMDASPYYIGPSDDLSRPGAMSYPTMGADTFPLWRNVSTIYHEGVPGHHLQVATSTIQRDALTAYQRLLSWNAGYGEGWALYAERLMDELGFFNDPAHRLGHLMDRAMRVARVVVDIGIHLRLDAPDGTPWGFDNAVAFFETHTLLPRDYVVSEINRYIAWPGQAISYSIGEQHWLDARAKALAAGLSMAEFHRLMLEAGSMPLEVFDRHVERICAASTQLQHS